MHASDRTLSGRLGPSAVTTVLAVAAVSTTALSIVAPGVSTAVAFVLLGIVAGYSLSGSI